MNMHARTFEDRPAVRQAVPLLVGLMGPSGSGKTFSALRLATGIQRVTGGDIYVIDTEARRALHYADRFKFRHLSFDPPFGSLDYLAALRHCVGKGAGVVIVDSMSHEHEGQGGLIDLHDQEMTRLAGDDYGKRERVKMLAWQKPKANRRALINGLLQLNANFIFCFRAKETAKPLKKDGKTEVVPMGYMPIAGEEFVFEQTVNCLLLPAAKGVPTWQSENVGERAMMKLPKQFEDIFAERRPLSEEIGHDLAEWAKGGAPREDTAKEPGPELISRARQAAGQGMTELQAFWSSLPAADQRSLASQKDELKTIAAKADDEGAQLPTAEPESDPRAVAYEAGEAARVKGLALSAVPPEYRANSELTEAWKDGWRAKDKELSQA
ncbi:MAG: AAA family ATPase [Bradyrhizobium sp.]|uniref:AAA family ATPase n=1 Tax=Bradyrhizobium sp. TaxID=376 RepID=UPI003D0AB5EA